MFSESEKERKLVSLYEAKFLVPSFTIITPDEYKRLEKIENALSRIDLPPEIKRVILRSAHQLEGRAGLSWTGKFESIEDVFPNPEAIQKAYNTILKSDFKALRYAKRHNVKDFSIADMGGILMPQIPWDQHLMFRSRSEENGGGLDFLVQTPSGMNRYERGSVDFKDGDNNEYWSERYREPSDLVYAIVEHFGNPQEIELCRFNDKLYVLQSRDFDPIKQDKEYPMHAKIPDKEMPVYVIDETKKELSEIDAELREFGLTHDEYCVVLLNAKQTMGRNVDDRGSEFKFKNLGYSEFFEEATVSFIPHGCMRPWGTHYEWDTQEFHCYRTHSFQSSLSWAPATSDAIKTSIGNPTKIYNELKNG